MVPSSFAELQVGDQLRVLGDRTSDGAKLLAEQVVSGAFQIVSGGWSQMFPSVCFSQAG